MTHVLVVDDELSIRETFQVFLEEEGYDVTTAADFFEAESSLAEHPCDIVVADIILPRVNGLALLQRVRDLDTDIPVIMVTGEPDVSTAAESVRHGAYDYIAKPVIQEVLIRVVGHAAERKHLLDEKRRLEAENLSYQVNLERKVSNRTAELAALIEIGHDISATLDLTEVLKRVTRRATQVCGAPRCTILLLTEDEEILTPIMSQFGNGHIDQELWRLFSDTIGQPWRVRDVSEEIRQTIQGHQPLFIPDASVSSLPQHWIEPFGIKSILLVPLISKEQVIGLMALDHVEEGRGFIAEQVDLAMAVASQAAVAIENARLHGEAERRLREMTALHETALDITAQLEMPRLLNAIIARASDLLGATGGLVYLYDAARERLAAVTSRDLKEDYTGLTFKVGEGVAGRVFQTGEPLIVDDHRAWAGKSPQVADAIARSILGIPLRWQERVIGVLNIIDNVRVGAFSEQDLRLLVPFANQAAIAIENARSFQNERKRTSQLAVVNQVARQIASILDLEQLIQEIVTAIQQGFGYFNVTLFLIDETSDELKMAALHGGFESMVSPDYNQAVGAGLIGWTAETGLSFLVNDVSQEPRYIPGFLDKTVTNSELCVPLKMAGQVIGVLDVQDTRLDAFDETDLVAMQTLADQIALAIENARLFEAAQQEIAERKRAEKALQERATRLELVAGVGQRTTAILELDELLHQAVDLIGDTFGYYNANIMLVENGHVVLRATSLPITRHLEGRLRLRVGSEGIIGWVAGSGEPLLVPDVSQESRYHVVREEVETRSELAVPIKLKGLVIGVLDVQSAERDTFSPTDVFTLQTVADQLAIAIENAQLYEETRRHVEELTVLHNIDVAITSTLNLDDVLQIIYQQVNEVMHPTTFFIGLYDEEKDELYFPITVEEGEQWPPLTLKVEERGGLSGRVIRTQEPLWVEDMEKQDSLSREAVTRGLASRSLMIWPLVAKDKLIGVISVQFGESHAFDEGHRRLFSGIARQVAIAVENARLFEETNRRLNEILLLHDVALTTTASLDFDDILRHTVESVRDRLQLDLFGFLLVDEEAGVARLHPTSLGIPDETADFSIPLGEGVTGWVAQTGQPLLVPDVSQESRYRDAVPGMRSEVCVPLKVGDKVIGVIDAESVQLDAFSEDHVRLFSTLASQLGVVLENAQLFEETNRRLAETRLLQEVMQAAASTLDFDEVLTRTIETLHRTLGIEFLGFVLPDEQTGGLVAHPSRIGHLPSAGSLCLSLDGSVCGQVYQSGEPQIISDAQEIPYYFEATPGNRSEMAAPVKVAGRVVAVLNAESTRAGAFGEEDLRLFSAVAAQLGVVMENARLFEETERRLAETRLLQEVMQAAASTLDFDEVLTRTIEILHRTLGIDYLVFALPDERENCMMLHSSQIGFPPVSDPLLLDGSVCGRVYQSGEPQIIPDVREVPYYFKSTPEIRSELAVPVKVAGRVVAVLNAENAQLGAFGEEDLRLFSAVAAQVGVVLDNARLFEETNRRLAETRLLQEVMQAAASTLDFDEVLTRTIETLNRTLGIEHLTFVLPDERGTHLRVHPSWIGYSSMDVMIRIPIDKSVCGRAYQSGEMQVVHDVREIPHYFETVPEIRSELAAPVKVADRIIAVLDAESPQVGAFDEEYLRIFSAVTAQLGVVLENTWLYQKLEDQTGELTLAYDELREIDRLRTELVQNVSHELRTPLSLIQGYVELLLDGDLGQVLDSQQDALLVIRKRAAALSRLIHNLTMLQDAPRQALTLIPLSVVEVVRQAVGRFRHSAQQTGISFHEELPTNLPPVLGDRERLNLIFDHLVDNAIKFSPDGGTIITRAWADQKMVYVSVSDEGIGIAPEYLDRIFERFYQVDGSARRRFGGMGIGLALVWEIVQDQGGTVTVESESGQGSTFTVALPVASSQ